MRLIDRIREQAAQEQSYFLAQLLREDLARLEKLQALAAAVPDAAAFRKAGSRIGWTAGDARTAEIRAPLERFLDACYAMLTKDPAGSDAAVEAAWRELHRERMERLLGCLSTPPPRPEA